MKKILFLTAMFAMFAFNGANAEVIGIIDFDKIVDNYTKVKTVSDEIADKYAEIQRYTLDKEREYKKLSTPLERKNFEEATAKELSKKQEAYLKLKEKKEAEIDNAIKNAIKQTAINSKVDTVIEKSVVFFGGIDLTDQVVKLLNSGSLKK
ncbi:MAG: OmpH family outer membrane protein [Candidatus Gastranaerophilales bacterium]|nr:OmpH family outer membrane protein [Candidatus Gastranaerophilales bacterium]